MTFLYHTTDSYPDHEKSGSILLQPCRQIVKILYIFFFVCWIGDDMKCQM